MADMEAMRGPKLSEEAQRARERGGAIVNERGELVKDIDSEIERIDENVDATDEANQQAAEESGFISESGEFVAEEEDHEHNIYINGKSYPFRQYVGIGYLNLETGRGEVKVQPGDYIVDYGEVKAVIPAGMFESMQDSRNEKTRDANQTRKNAMNESILNNKSGPDKFTYPVEPIGIDKLERPGPPGPLGVVGTASSAPVGAKNPNPQREETLRPAESVGPDTNLVSHPETGGTVRSRPEDVRATQRQRDTSGVGYQTGDKLVADPNAEAKTQETITREARERAEKGVRPPDAGSAPANKGQKTIEELQAAKNRGEKLTGMEEARLMDARKKK